MKSYTLFGAADYNCNVYGNGAYNVCGASTNTGGNTGPLANTGYDIIIPVALGAALVVASIFYATKKLLRKKA